MSADGRPAESTPVAPGLEGARFVRLVTRADGDALAASGIVARALADRGTPFQVTVGRTVATRTDRARAPEAGEDDVTVAIGAVDADVPRLDAPDRPATLSALEAARDLEAVPDPVCALAGLVAAGAEPGAGESEWLLETARERALVDRRPGVAVPTADPVDGLAHSTLVRAPWSGDREATAETLAEIGVDESAADLDAEARRGVASLVAIDVVGAEEASVRAAEAVARALRPYATPDAPFATLGGYADVLEAIARAEPGTGAALTMGHDAREPALAAWRDQGRRAHDALSQASTARFDGLFVVSIDEGPVEAAARIAAAYRSPEPAVLAVAADEAALVTDGELSAGTVERIARDLESATSADASVEYDVGRRRGYLRYDPAVDESAVVESVREGR